jgi:hypothetical protein
MPASAPRPDIPIYSNPPVTEMLLSVQFATLPSLRLLVADCDPFAAMRYPCSGVRLNCERHSRLGINYGAG